VNAPAPIHRITGAPTEKLEHPNTETLNHAASILPLAVLAGFWGILIYHLGFQWSIYDQYNYGWAVPFLCAYLIWKGQQDRKTMQFRPRASSCRGPLVLWIFVLCGFAYAPTRWLHEANPIWRLTSWLWALEVIGLTLCIVFFAFSLAPIDGDSRNRLSSQLFQFSVFSFSDFLFPVCFFLVAVPWPTGLESVLTQFLKQLDITTTTELLGLFGIPAVPHGNVLEIRTGMVGVDEACSGIRSFQATLMISLFFGEFYRLPVLRRASLCLLGFALAFIFNIGRTLLLVSVASAKGIGAISAWHDPAGTTILVACFLCLWLIAWNLHKAESRKQKAESKGQKAQAEEGRSEDGAQRESTLSILAFRRLSVFLLAWLIVVELGTELWYRSHERGTVYPRASSSLPEWSIVPTGDLPGLVKTPIPSSIAGQFRADEALQARWRDAADQNWQMYYFRWLPARSLKKRVATQLAKTHGPEKCLPRSGIILQAYLGTILIAVDHLANSSAPTAATSPPFRLAFQQYAFTSDGQLVHVFYGIYEDPSGPTELANRRRDTRSRIAAALAGSRNYGQRFLEIAVTGPTDPDAARIALQQELGMLLSVKN
jgi:exosortase